MRDIVISGAGTLRIFVTGATGFIGAHFVERALAEGHEVVLNDAAFDSKLAQSGLGWYPKVDLAEGFAATLDASRRPT